MFQTIKNALAYVLPARKIKYLVVHHSGANGRQTVESILNFWKTPPPDGNGWGEVPGYHILIRQDGSAFRAYPDSKPTNGVRNHNSHSLHVCCIGGVGGKDERTQAQKDSLEVRLRIWLKQYPGAIIVGHRDLSPDKNKDGRVMPDEWVKKCPGFDAGAEYKYLYTEAK